MIIPLSSTQYVYIPIYGPAGVDLTQYAVDVAFIADDGSEPAGGQWKVGSWLAPAPLGRRDAALLITSGDYPVGSYMAWARLHAPPELVVLKSGRVRVGTP